MHMRSHGHTHTHRVATSSAGKGQPPASLVVSHSHTRTHAPCCIYIHTVLYIHVTHIHHELTQTHTHTHHVMCTCALTDTHTHCSKERCWKGPASCILGGPAALGTGKWLPRPVWLSLSIPRKKVKYLPEPHRGMWRGRGATQRLSKVPESTATPPPGRGFLLA